MRVCLWLGSWIFNDGYYCDLGNRRMGKGTQDFSSAMGVPMERLGKGNFVFRTRKLPQNDFPLQAFVASCAVLLDVPFLQMPNARRAWRRQGPRMADSGPSQCTSSPRAASSLQSEPPKLSVSVGLWHHRECRKAGALSSSKSRRAVQTGE